MKRLLLCFTGLLALATSSCALSSLLTVTPKHLIDQTASCPSDQRVRAEHFEVLSTQTWSQGVVILYRALCPTNDTKMPMRQIFGHKVVKRSGLAWQVSGSSSYGTETDIASPEQLVEYSINRSATELSTNAASQQEEPYTILSGRVLQPKVIAVEATFDNGKVLRDESSNGVFALLAAGSTNICELRIIGADNQILRKEELAVPKHLARSGQGTRCLPISHQL